MFKVTSERNKQDLKKMLEGKLAWELDVLPIAKSILSKVELIDDNQTVHFKWLWMEILKILLKYHRIQSLLFKKLIK